MDEQIKKDRTRLRHNAAVRSRPKRNTIYQQLLEHGHSLRQWGRMYGGSVTTWYLACRQCSLLVVYDSVTDVVTPEVIEQCDLSHKQI